MVNFLLVLLLTKLFSPALMVEMLRADTGRNCVFERGVGHFVHKFQRQGGSSTNDSWRQKTTVPGYHMVLFA